MFITVYNTYIAFQKGKFFQRHLSSYHDQEAMPPAAQKDFENAGIILRNLGEGLFSLFASSQELYIFSPDLTIHHGNSSVTAESYLKKIDPKDLPTPPPIIPAKLHIDKYIHQTGYPLSLPNTFLHNRDNLILLNPDYEYIYWSDGKEGACRAFVKENYGKDILRYYDSINPAYGAAKGDLFRYLCIYKMGGVYLDLKSTISVPLKHIILPDDRFLLSFFPNEKTEHHEINHIKYSSEYQQFVIICSAGHPLMYRIIHQTLCNISVYDPSFHGVGFQGTMRTTGPFMYSRIINSYRSPENTRLFHAFSSGIEYSIFKGHEHREKVGSTHYLSLSSPLILKDEYSK